ncbi:MAG TPA: DUF885 domain-containing protein [Steroidobacteraceae bacterium]
MSARMALASAAARFALASLALLALAAGASAWAATGSAGAGAAAGDAAGDAALKRLADEYLDAYYFPANPTAATEAGVHRYDRRLKDYSRAGVDRRVRTLRGYEQRFAAIDSSRLSEWARGDLELLLSSVRSQLLTLETIRPWQKNPDTYSSGISNAAFVLMQRPFAPADERLQCVIAREQAMPAALRAARANLRNPPAIYTRTALEQLPGIIHLFATDLPAAFADARPATLARFTAVNGRVIAALRSYQLWLQNSELARSHGDFRLGAATFSAKLRDDEMVDVPLERLLEIGSADLRRNQAEFARVAHELAPDKSARAVLAELAADHPAPQALLSSFRATFDGLVSFLDSHPIITIPSSVRPTLQETPPFMRATTWASMDTPGPFERTATQAFFFVTLPDPAWDPQHVEGFMAQFNYPVISDTAVHEAYPGHYIQFLWMHRIHDRVRALIGAYSNAEGWAHYCEQMMLDEGYGQPGAGAADERGARMLRLGQLQDALLRDARYIVGISMHTGRMSLDQAIDFFVTEGYQSREVGEVETKRGTSDPTYLYYTLGKLEILKLRADLQAREGNAFDLERFHDDFMQQGWPPIKIVRRALLHDDSPPL